MTLKKKMWLTFTALIVAGVGLIVFANVWKSDLIVKRVSIEGTRIIHPNEIRQLAHVNEGDKLFDVDLMGVQRDIATHPYVKAVVVERDIPSTLKISVTERMPLAMISRQEISYIDEAGVVLPQALSRELLDLPVVSGLPPGLQLKPGSQLSHRDIRECLEILEAARLVSKELYHLISEIRLRSGGDVVLYATEWGVPIIYGRGDAVRKLVYLETLWHDVVRQRGSQHIQYIDLRFENQIVVRWNDQKSL